MTPEVSSNPFFRLWIRNHAQDNDSKLREPVEGLHPMTAVARRPSRTNPLRRHFPPLCLDLLLQNPSRTEMPVRHGVETMDQSVSKAAIGRFALYHVNLDADGWSERKGE